MPERLPWREGTVDEVIAGTANYFVIDGVPQPGNPIRERDDNNPRDEMFVVLAAPGTGGLTPSPEELARQDLSASTRAEALSLLEDGKTNEALALLIRSGEI